MMNAVGLGGGTVAGSLTLTAEAAAAGRGIATCAFLSGIE